MATLKDVVQTVRDAVAAAEAAAAAAEAAAAGASGGFVISNSPTKPMNGKAATYWVTSAVSWPAGIVWSDEPDGGTPPTITSAALVSLFTVAGTTYGVAGSLFTADAAPDTTPPTAGTLAASAITSSGFTLTVTGAVDDVALHATPYSFSTNNGGAWSAYQSGPTYPASGLTGNTAYTCRHRVRDAAGNVATGSSIVATTDPDPALAPVLSWLFNEGSGTTAAAAGGGPSLTVDATAWTASGHSGAGILSTTLAKSAVGQWAPGSLGVWSTWAGLTYGGWIKGGTAGAQIALGTGSNPNTTNPPTFIGIKANNFTVGSAGSTTDVFTPTLDVSGWHHFAVTYAGGTMRAYIDGVQIGTNSRQPFGSGQALDGIIVGSRFAATNSTIDGVRVYDVALSAPEITAWMGET